MRTSRVRTVSRYQARYSVAPYPYTVARRLEEGERIADDSQQHEDQKNEGDASFHLMSLPYETSLSPNTISRSRLRLRSFALLRSRR
jgi:hypothetical protein